MDGTSSTNDMFFSIVLDMVFIGYGYSRIGAPTSVIQLVMWPANLGRQGTDLLILVPKTGEKTGICPFHRGELFVDQARPRSAF